MSGKSFASRVAGSLLEALDCGDMITHSLDEYIETAVSLAKNSRNRGLRAGHIVEKLDERDWAEANARSLLGCLSELRLN
jgi:predicted O-linked N-acetylglucosamine transferase (SPINDLY family)